VQARGGPGAPHTGVVTEFDDPRGLGALRDDDGRLFPFHCSALSDGSRTVAVGTRVAYTVVAGHGGRYEARAVNPLLTS